MQGGTDVSVSYDAVAEWIEICASGEGNFLLQTDQPRDAVLRASDAAILGMRETMDDVEVPSVWGPFITESGCLFRYDIFEPDRELRAFSDALADVGLHGELIPTDTGDEPSLLDLPGPGLLDGFGISLSARGRFIRPDGKEGPLGAPLADELIDYLWSWVGAEDEDDELYVTQDLTTMKHSLPMAREIVEWTVRRGEYNVRLLRVSKDYAKQAGVHSGRQARIHAQVLLPHSAGIMPHVRQLRQHLLRAAAFAQYGTVERDLRREDAPWARTDEYWQTVGGPEYATRPDLNLTRQLAKQPLDVFGIQLLERSFLGDAPLPTGWTTVDAGHGLVLLEAADLQPWLANTPPERAVLTQAREQFAHVWDALI
jgi:hypothetical protein